MELLDLVSGIIIVKGLSRKRDSLDNDGHIKGYDAGGGDVPCDNPDCCDS